LWYPIVSMKKLVLVLVVWVGALAWTARVQAQEGTVALSGEGVVCEGISLWKERNYRVTGRCEGLVYPHATQLEHYVLWAKPVGRSELVRVAEVDRGYFDGNVSEGIEALYMTAESDGLPRRPSSTQVASGGVTEFSFATGEVQPVETPAPLGESETQKEGLTVQNGAGAASSGAVGAVVGKIVKSLLVIVGVVVALVIGTSLVFRKKGSVSV